MPTMTRSSKNQKIVNNIIGKPSSFNDKQSSAMAKVNSTLKNQESSRLR